MHKERPILYQGAMVRAVLSKMKRQTRRVIKGLHPDCKTARLDGIDWKFYDQFDRLTQAMRCRYGVPGDRLWVREAWSPGAADHDAAHVLYRCDFPDGQLSIKFKPSIHMPRWASRILLEITEVRVERLQDISRGDAMDEGYPFPNMAQGDDPRQWYAELWDQINGAGAWEANPWVWAVTFKPIPSTGGLK